MKNFKLKGLKYINGHYSLYNDRFVFFPPQVIDILSSIYGEGVKSLLVWLGKKAGWQLVQNWEEKLKPKTLEDLVDQFCDLLSAQGWGKFEPKIKEKKIISVVVKSVISSEMESKSKFICYFITGLLSGLGEFGLYKVRVTEQSCRIENAESEFCEYKIEKID